MNTHKFKLVSGPECEVRELTGKHQRLLTEQKNKKIGDNLNELLADVVVRIGSLTDFSNYDDGNDKNVFFKRKLLAPDKKKILTEVRQFTMEHDPEFKFKYEYTDQENNSKEYEHAVDLSEGFPEHSFKEPGLIDAEEEGAEPVPGLVEWKCEEYADVLKKVDYRVTLPKSGKIVALRLLDGFGESVGVTAKKQERSSHTPILMRSPRYVTQAQDGKQEVLINVTMDALSFKDIEFLRKTIKEREGQVDTEIKFEHPEADNRQGEEKYVTVDLLAQVAFFFPSEAI